MIVVSTCCECASITTVKYAKQLEIICLWNSIFYHEQSVLFLEGKRESERKETEFFSNNLKLFIGNIDFMFFFFVSFINVPNAYATKSIAMNCSALKKKWRIKIGLNAEQVLSGIDEKKEESMNVFSLEKRIHTWKCGELKC